MRAPRKLPPLSAAAASSISSSSSSLSPAAAPASSSSSLSLAPSAAEPAALASLDALGGRGAASDCGARAEADALSGGGRVVFFSFASGEYLVALRRILAEARATGVFDEVLGFTPDDIPRDYFLAHADVLNNTRGRGFWAWKPYFLRRILDRLAPGDVVMFADAGCEFTGNPQTYVDVARRYGFLGFRLPLWPKHAVKRWTKGDIFRAVGLDMRLYGDERQHVGGIFLIAKTPRNERFVDDWLRLCEDAQLVTDRPSVAPNHPEFDENRHDQAIYSLLIMKHAMGLVLEDRTFPRSLAPVIHAARRRD